MRNLLLTTFIILFLLIIGSIWIKYSSTKSVDANLETREELNDMLHMKNLFKYIGISSFCLHFGHFLTAK